jgi:ribosomal protein S18
LKQKLDDYNLAVKDKNDEWNTGKFSGKPGRGEYYDGLVEKANSAQKDYNTTNSNYSNSNTIDYARIKTLDDKIADREKVIHSDVENQKTVQAQNDGLLARLTALSSLTSKEWTLSFAKWLITALFIFIEIAPILFKMMTERGPYDDIVDRIKHETKVRQLELQSNINQEINTAVRLHTEKHEHKLNAELQANKEILEAIAKAQQELAVVAIEKWKEEQKQILLNGNLHDTVK